jgi:hypothetical protein
MFAQLQALTPGPDIVLDKPLLLLGRHPDCDVCLKSRKVSRRHCCIARAEDGIFIRDLGSKNGIRINGRRVAAGYLRPSDELVIGRHRYRVQEGAPAALRQRSSWPVSQPAEPPGSFLPTHLAPEESGELPVALSEDEDETGSPSDSFSTPVSAPAEQAAQATLPLSLSGTQPVVEAGPEKPAEESSIVPPPFLEPPMVREAETASVGVEAETGEEVPGRLMALGLFALLLGALAVLSASLLPVLVVPLGGVGLLAGLAAVGLAHFRYGSWLRLGLAGAAVSAAVLLLAVLLPGCLGPAYLTSRPVATPSAETIQAIPISGRLGENVGDADWPDASKALLVQGGLRLQVLDVSLGPVKLPGAAKKKYSKEKYLLIRLRFQQTQGAQEFINRDWKLPDLSGAPDQARLSDAAGKTYRQQDILDVGGVRGVQRSGVFPVAIVEVVLVFEPPPASAAPLRLEVPAGPWGGSGTFHFTIPASLIHQER